MSYIEKNFGKINDLAERKKIIKELTQNGYNIKFNALAARNEHENVTVFYNSKTFKHMLLFNDSYINDNCESYFLAGSKVKLI